MHFRQIDGFFPPSVSLSSVPQHTGSTLLRKGREPTRGQTRMWYLRFTQEGYSLFYVPSRFQIGFHIRFICISGHWARCWSKVLVLVSVHFFVVEIISGLVSVEFHIGFICGRRHLHNFICGIWLPLLHICSLGSYWFVVLVSDIVSGRAVQVVFQIMFQVRFQIRFQVQIQVQFQVFISGTVFAPGPLGRV